MLLHLAKRYGALRAGGAASLVEFHQSVEVLQDAKITAWFLFNEQLHGLLRSVCYQSPINLAVFEELLGEAARLLCTFHQIRLGSQFPVGFIDQALLIFCRQHLATNLGGGFDNQSTYF